MTICSTEDTHSAKGLQPLIFVTLKKHAMLLFYGRNLAFFLIGTLIFMLSTFGYLEKPNPFQNGFKKQLMNITMAIYFTSPSLLMSTKKGLTEIE